ncbi:MAG: hypothetical protein ABIU06_01750 [Anaerolineales bacterium]
MSKKFVMGSLLAIALLVGYVYFIYSAIAIVRCATTEGCTERKLTDFTDQMAFGLTSIGGLISALVTAELAITKPNKSPQARIFDSKIALQQRDSTLTRIVSVVTWAYLIIWLVAGGAAVLVGYFQHAKVLQPLTDFAQAWMGIALAAVYAYFGIDPDQ